MEAPQRIARPRMRADLFENRLLSWGFFTRRIIKLNEKRRLRIPILELDKMRPKIITTALNPMRRLFPSRTES
jgi:hypothetical protein